MSDGLNSAGMPWYKQGLSFECCRCGGCCTGAPGFVWVSDEEAVQIAEYLGIGRDEFIATYTRLHGLRRTIREVGDNYDCMLLGDKGCRIYPVRPIQCRTWPFWRMNVKTPEAWADTVERCPGAGKGRRYSREEIEERAKNSP